jgi:uncharacterized protein YbgA (DUF1722 family)/uncharacterized protein YbbK (DUF523 family)
MEAKIKLGISSCLLGNAVRYDGGHKWDRFLTDTLGRFVDFVPVCPEVEVGLGIPREAMRLVGDFNHPRLLTIRSRIDHTERMNQWAQTRVKELEVENLCGFVFKSDSPSSGLERVKIYDPKGIPVKKGVGLFARVFMDYFPLLPVEDEGRLHDPLLRENFIESIFVWKRWREMVEQNKSKGGLVDFHSRHKLLLMAHSPKQYQTLGHSVAQGKGGSLDDLFLRYQEGLSSALRQKPTNKKNANVLQHILGYFKKDLAPDEKQEALEGIENYARGFVPLIVPVTLMNHYVRKYYQPYLKNQYFLNPHPLELQLRNHA